MRTIWRAGLLGVWLAASSAWAMDDTPRRTQWGVQLDLGLPDAVGLSALYRPVRFVRLEAGPLYNLAGWGMRGGVTFVPFEFAITPTLTFEVGHYFSGNVNRAIAMFTQQPLEGSIGAALKDVTYTFGNLQLGIELGSPRHFMFSIRAGLTYAIVNVAGIGKVLQDAAGDSSLTLKDPTLRFVSPSAKIGFMVFF